MNKKNNNKKNARIRRGACTRYKQKLLNVTRLVIYKSLCHIYAQIINSNTNKVLVSASTLEKIIYSNLEKTSNKNAAILIGKIIAERAIEKNIKNVSFDRSGFKYHGKLKVLADSARENGLIF